MKKKTFSKIKVNKAYQVCGDCGSEHGNGRRDGVSTWHIDVCDICGDTRPVTEFRDFGYSKYTSSTNH